MTLSLNMMLKSSELTRLSLSLALCFFFLFQLLQFQFLYSFFLGWFALPCTMMLMVSVNIFPSSSSLSLLTLSPSGPRLLSFHHFFYLLSLSTLVSLLRLLLSAGSSCKGIYNVHFSDFFFRCFPFLCFLIYLSPLPGDYFS